MFEYFPSKATHNDNAEKKEIHRMVKKKTLAKRPQKETGRITG